MSLFLRMVWGLEYNCFDIPSFLSNQNQYVPKTVINTQREEAYFCRIPPLFHTMLWSAKPNSFDALRYQIQNVAALTNLYWLQHVLSGHVWPGVAAFFPYSAIASQFDVHPAPQYVSPYPQNPLAPQYVLLLHGLPALQE